MATQLTNVNALNPGDVVHRLNGEELPMATVVGVRRITKVTYSKEGGEMWTVTYNGDRNAVYVESP